MNQTIVDVISPVRFVPVVDCFTIDEAELTTYPRLGDFVDLSQLTDIEALRIFCRKLYPKIDSGEIRRMPGGYCLMNGNLTLFEPQCCADLCDAEGWKSVADFNDPEWSRPYYDNGWIRIWFGHPQLAAQRAGNRIWLAQDNDTDEFPVLPAEGQPIYSVSVSDLQSALGEVDKQMMAIRSRLLSALVSLIPDSLREAAVDLMLNGENGRYDELSKSASP